LGDLDKDGNMDIVVANSAGDTYSILHGLGSGTFGSTTTYALNGSGYNARAIALTDMDGDGFLDIVVASTMISGGSGSNDRVSVEINQGTGAHFSHVAYAVAYDPRGLAIGDVNGDGMPDVVTANMSGAVTVLLGIGAGNLGLPTYHPASLGAYGVAIGDLNGDGLLDIVATTSSYGATKYNSIEYLLNTGGGTFALSNPITVGSEPVGIALADIDRSGRLDIFTANRSSNDITMLVNIMPPTVGVSQYGTGTSGCAGELGLDANSVPSIGNANFAIIGASAPHSTLGVMLVSDVKDFNGSDLFGINILLHVGLSPSFNGVNAYSGPSGEQFAPMPVPAMPALIGKTFYFQTAWVEPIGLRCTPGTSGLESSRGLSVTIQP
jgi:hypothetical protein